MRQSIAEIEDQFFEEIEDDRERREKLRKRAERRAAQRQAKRQHRHGSMRFWVLVLVLMATAAIVTYAMFMTLYYVLSPS
jgi:membrane glycosyltransferase